MALQSHTVKGTDQGELSADGKHAPICPGCPVRVVLFTAAQADELASTLSYL